MPVAMAKPAALSLAELIRDPELKRCKADCVEFWAVSRLFSEIVFNMMAILMVLA